MFNIFLLFRSLNVQYFPVVDGNGLHIGNLFLQGDLVILYDIIYYTVQYITCVNIMFHFKFYIQNAVLFTNLFLCFLVEIATV